MISNLTEKINLLDQVRGQLEPFANRQFDFRSDNFQSLTSELSEADSKHFNCACPPASPQEIREVVTLGFQFLKKYKLKEDVSEAGVAAARRRLKMLYVREVLLNVFMYGLFYMVIRAIYQLIVQIVSIFS